MDGKIQSLMRRDTLEIFPRKSVDDHNVLTVTWYFKHKKKPDLAISKFKAHYCVIRDVQKRLSPELFSLYYTVV